MVLDDGRKQAGMVMEFTREQIMEISRCANDFVYFTKYCVIKTDKPTTDNSTIELRPYQIEMANMFVKNRFSIILSSRQSGKCVSGDTKIKIKNKKTGIIEEISIKDFYDRVKNKNVSKKVDGIKFIDESICNEYEVLTPDGWKDFNGVGKTIEYNEYKIILEDDVEIICADTHIFTVDNRDIFCKDLCALDYLDTIDGKKQIKSIEMLDTTSNMYDLIDVEGSLYYTNDIVSHNTTTCACYVLWYLMFQEKRFVGIVSNNAKSAQEILYTIKDMYLDLPDWLKPGISGDWNKQSLIFENGSRIQTSATSANSFRGRAVNLLLMDEFAFVPNNLADAFWASNYPTISASPTSQIIIISTPCGMFNAFHEIYSRARTNEEMENYRHALATNNQKFLDSWDAELKDGKKNAFVRAKFDWRVVPGRDDEWAAEQLGNLKRVRFNQEFECLGGKSRINIDGQNISLEDFYYGRSGTEG